MNDDLENIKQKILNQIQREFRDINEFDYAIRKQRSEIIKNLSDSYVTLSKVSSYENNMKHEPKPIPTATYDKGFKL